VTDELLRLARWLEAQPWNRPGSEKSWVLATFWGGVLFARERRRAERVAEP
jgi:hypothetical protein